MEAANVDIDPQLFTKAEAIENEALASGGGDLVRKGDPSELASLADVRSPATALRLPRVDRHGESLADLPVRPSAAHARCSPRDHPALVR